MLQKRLDYGFNGFQVPFIPKAARSSRRRGGVGKKVEDNQLCAFDLLATVAGNLLLEGETSQNTPVEKDQDVNYEDVVMEEQHDEVNPAKVEHCDQPGSEIPKGNASPAPAVLDKMDLSDHLGDELCNHLAKPEQCPAVPKDSCMPNQGEELSQNSSFKLSLSTNRYMSGSVSPSRGGNNSNNNTVKVVTRDDDENSSGCTHPRTLKPARWASRAGGRRIRRLLASKHRRVAPKVKGRDISETELRYVYCSRKNGYKRQRSQRIYPFKKRKSFYYRTLSNSDRNINYNKGIYAPEKALDNSAASFGAVGHGVKGSSSSVSGQSTSFQSRESQVKVRIKSFRVPELFIEMPESATIGSLKRTVMETLTALLGGGLHVGVLFQGKKMRDDNRTLLQSGIGRNDKVDSLGFTLEPNRVDASAPIVSEDDSLVLSSDVPQPLSTCPDASTMNGGTSHPSSDHPMNSIGQLVESDHDSAPSPGETSGDKGTVDSRALVAVPDGTPQALSVVPAQHKSKRAEMAQRRIRRPFSVTEVEALVQAVEQLGTGRWRDVKLRAFDDAKHRTYVDLKDKWKTLVHTARISPQQRRGEPVPQELLDRVLAAHAYWSQQQAKQQLKQQPEPCLLL